MEEHSLDHSFTDRIPLLEQQDSISYLGVKLPKADDRESPFVPSPQTYQDYINDRFSLHLQRDIAVSLLQGDPVCIEGGTSIGKTTTVRKMAAELGYEVHYINLNGASDVEDLMGRYIPNPVKKSSDDPEYVFQDGKVTSGLRQEEGKIKLIILDEYNSANSSVLIRLHEVLDALDRNQSVVLSEDGSESIPVDKSTTKVVALMNPPGKGYFERQPLDVAQLRRWVYIKAPSKLPDDTFRTSTRTLFSLANTEEPLPDTLYLHPLEDSLTPEQLSEIPGIEVIVEKYLEFHKAANELLRQRTIAADQPQPFDYDDRVEPQRVSDFVRRFYNGDINETIQQALRYYYANKLESTEDKAKLEELIAHVVYIPPVNVSKRKGLEVPSLQPTEEKMDDIVSREQREWEQILGAEITVEPLPDEITPDIQKEIESLGFEFRYIPQLDIGTIDDLRMKGVDKFLEDIKAKYPAWNVLEEIFSQWEDIDVSRQLNKEFWINVYEYKIEFPQFDGHWVAVETTPKPNSWEEYDTNSIISNYLSLSIQSLRNSPSRYDLSWSDAQDSIEDVQKKLSYRFPFKIRLGMLPAHEWNLLANREAWGSTTSYEWTGTPVSNRSGYGHVVVGASRTGGAGSAEMGHYDTKMDLGFRIAMYFPKEKRKIHLNQSL